MHSRCSGAGSLLRNIFLRIPAIRALFAQLTSFAIVLALAFVLPAMADMQLSIALAALIQGVISAMLARALRLAPWWLAIQFLFPAALVALTAVQLPSWLYLGAFLILLFLYWSTFRTQVPFYPSTTATRHAVAELLPKGRSLRVIDIGSGFGGLVMHLARLRPESEIVGIELAPLPWLFSLLRARVGGGAGRFVRGDYEKLDFGDYDVVFAYLSPAAMPALWRKASAEMRAGALLLSCEFNITGMEPDIVVHPAGAGPAIYGWQIK